MGMFPPAEPETVLVLSPHPPELTSIRGLGVRLPFVCAGSVLVLRCVLVQVLVLVLVCVYFRSLCSHCVSLDVLCVCGQFRPPPLCLCVLGCLCL